MSVLKNFCDWPLNSWSAVRALTAATAPAFRSRVGRTTDTSGRPRRNWAGSGRIRLVWVASPPPAVGGGGGGREGAGGGGRARGGGGAPARPPCWGGGGERVFVLPPADGNHDS